APCRRSGYSCGPRHLHGRAVAARAPQASRDAGGRLRGIMGSFFRIFPEQASTIAARVDGLYMFLLGVAVFFSGLIFLLILYFAIKYRRRPGHTRAQQVGPHNLLEITWILIPLAIAMVIFVWGARLYAMVMLSPPANALEI